MFNKEIFKLLRYAPEEVKNACDRSANTFGAAMLNPFGETPKNHGIDKPYFIATAARTGATYLCSVLNNCGLGTPGEFLNASNKQVTYFKSYIHEMINKHNKTGIFGIKASMYDLLPFIARPHDFFDFSLWQWVYVTRSDIIGQAISLYIAETTGIWRHDDPKTAKAEPEYNREAIIDRMLVLAEDNRRWEIFFNYYGITPLRLSYTQINDDVLACAGQIRKFLDIPQRQMTIGGGFEKQANTLNAAFRKELQASFDKAIAKKA